MAADMDIDMDLDVGMVEDDYAIAEVDIVPDTQASVRTLCSLQKQS